MNKVSQLVFLNTLDSFLLIWCLFEQSHRYIGSDESGDENRPRGKSGRLARKGSIASQKSSERDSLMFT